MFSDFFHFSMPIVRMVKPVKIETPSDFDEIWSMVKSLRAVRDAPVDIWGCDKVVDIKAEKKVFEFQILVAAMLSSQTKDRYVKEAMDNLRASELSVSGILAKTEDEIDTLIKMVCVLPICYSSFRLVFTKLKRATFQLSPSLFLKSIRVIYLEHILNY